MLRDIPRGTLVDERYRIVSRVGSGGMADVYCAEDQQLGRMVALKLLHHRFAEDREFVERFRREASSAAGLQHPNIVAVYDRGAWDGTSYIAMEYVPGRTLKRLVEEEAPLEPVRAIDLTVQMLRAARFAHRRGIVHRDLKPHNVIVDDEDRVKVTDFGIARAGGSEMTQTGSIMGTAQYLSPEQAQGTPVTPRSDLYSIGIVLYELLTGHVPFDGESAVTIALKQVNEAPLPPRNFNSAVTPELESVVLRALAKDPQQRFADADEMILALERARASIVDGAAGDPGATAAFAPVGPEAHELAADDAHRGRRWWIALAVLVAALAVGAAVYALTRPDMRAVPDVTGRPLAAALAILHNAGFDPSVQRTTSDAPEGRVLRQDPQPGEEAEVGSEVTLTVSDGPGTAPVPDVVGLRRKRALAALEDAGFEVRERRQASDSVERNRVISTTPPAGTPAERGSTVTLVLSSGPEQVAVPDVQGEDVDDARSRLEAAGLAATVTEQEDLEAQPGTVLAQSPAPGTAVDKGSTVALTVAVEPAEVTVPEVIGLRSSRAIRILTEAGLVPNQITELVGERRMDGRVIAQAPEAGGTAERDSRVTITVGAYDPALDPDQEPEPAPPTETLPAPTPEETP